MLAPEDNTGRPYVLALEEEAGCAGGQGRVGQQEVPALEDEAGRPEVFASEDEAGRPQVLALEDEAGWPKVLTLEEEAVAPDVLADEARRPEVFTQTNVRCGR